tara:strand:+ start:1403 stop:1726 length:324 start_codon:yes stop_codon:yes gene_type:complete
MKNLPNKKIYIGDEPKAKKEEGHVVEPPPLKDQIVGFAKSFTKWVSEGAPLVTPKVYMERLTTCHVCPSFNKKQGRCLECGCMMEYKARMKTSECPKHKWKEEDVKK